MNLSYIKQILHCISTLVSDIPLSLNTQGYRIFLRWLEESKTKASTNITNCWTTKHNYETNDYDTHRQEETGWMKTEGTEENKGRHSQMKCKLNWDRGSALIKVSRGQGQGWGPTTLAFCRAQKSNKKHLRLTNYCLANRTASRDLCQDPKGSMNRWGLEAPRAKTQPIPDK